MTDYRYGLARPDDVAGKTGRHLLNPMGGVHGGWALTLIDSVAGCAGHSLLPAGAGYTTIETKGNFSRPITRDAGRVLVADGKVLAPGTSTLLVLNGAR